MERVSQVVAEKAMGTLFLQIFLVPYDWWCHLCQAQALVGPKEEDKEAS